LIGWIRRYLHTFTGFGRDARLFLLTTIVFGAAQSLFWIDFNLYLESIGLDKPTIGWLMAAQQLAGVVTAFPASALSSRLGRRNAMALGMAAVTAALLLFLPGDRSLIYLGTIAMGAGGMVVGVVQVPFIAEHTLPEQRNEYFATWSAIGFLTGLVAALVGGQVAPFVSDMLQMPSGSGPYQILLSGVAILGVLSLGTVFLLGNDTPSKETRAAAMGGRFGIVIHDKGLFVRLLLPGFITSLGAGQLIPFLNLFVETKFGLNLSAINSIFAITSLGTALAIMIQPAIARRFGRIGSMVLVQALSIPFLGVMGFSPVLWTVVVALAVRNSLMNAGGPMFDAYAMDRIAYEERATLTAGMTLLWSLGWTIAPLYYGVLQAQLGFTAGYAVDFVTIIVLYSVSTFLLWYWFHGTESDREPVATEGAVDQFGSEAAGAASATARPEPSATLTDGA
jgi:MFS family permease